MGDVTARRWSPATGLQVAVDGPSGSGKGTVAKMLAEVLGLPVLDTGLLYRYVACSADAHGIDVNDELALLHKLDEMIVEMDWRPEGIFVQGRDWTDKLRSEEIGKLASKVAEKTNVRGKLRDVQRRQAEGGCVMDGRDIGTVVLPQAQAKFFLTASARERARRRWLQLQGLGVEASFDTVIADLKARDLRDTERAHAPLEKSQDAVQIDSTTLRADEVVDRMLAILQRRKLIRPVEKNSTHQRVKTSS